jgi:CRISPR-associated endonuclease/helicase Cas3
MAAGASSPDPSTRWIETSRGILSYSQLAPLIAERVLRVQQNIESGAYAALDITEELICALHGDFSRNLFPDWGGKYRNIRVRVGPHEATPPHRIRLEMHDYIADLRERFDHVSSVTAALPDLLAFAEGRLLSIHPFADFNGRVARLWLWELLRRLRLPPVELAPNDPLRVEEYLQALRAADHKNWEPLQALWIRRLANAL